MKKEKNRICQTCLKRQYLETYYDIKLDWDNCSYRFSLDSSCSCKGKIDIDKAMKAQLDYCEKMKYPRFAPVDGICYYCKNQIYSLISAERAGEELITACPHCCRSYDE